MERKSSKAEFLMPVHGCRAWLATSLMIFSLAAIPSAHASTPLNPLVRGPGVSQLEFEAFAAAEGRITWSESHDLNRPEKEFETKLRRLLEKSQSAWLAASIDSARIGFKEIASMALDADWRDAHREVIFYSMLRLAQSAHSGLETDEWLEKAAVFAADLTPDKSVFPPPLMKPYEEARSRVLGLGRSIELFQIFPEHKIVLINGKKHQITPDVKIQLASGVHRITALSDLHAPLTERMSAAQLAVLKVSLLPLVTGACDSPFGLDSLRSGEAATVLYPQRCLRMRAQVGWLHPDQDIADVQAGSSLQTRTMPTSSLQATSIPSAMFDEPSKTVARPTRRTWLWIGAGTLAAGTAYVIHREMNRSSPAPRIEPTHTQGF